MPVGSVLGASAPGLGQVDVRAGGVGQVDEVTAGDRVREQVPALEVDGHEVGRQLPHLATCHTTRYRQLPRPLVEVLRLLARHQPHAHLIPRGTRAHPQHTRHLVRPRSLLPTHSTPAERGYDHHGLIWVADGQPAGPQPARQPSRVDGPPQPPGPQPSARPRLERRRMPPPPHRQAYGHHADHQSDGQQAQPQEAQAEYQRAESGPPMRHRSFDHEIGGLDHQPHRDEDHCERCQGLHHRRQRATELVEQPHDSHQAAEEQHPFPGTRRSSRLTRPRRELQGEHARTPCAHGFAGKQPSESSAPRTPWPYSRWDDPLWYGRTAWF